MDILNLFRKIKSSSHTSSSHSKDEIMETEQIEYENTDNGLVLNSHSIPEEILSYILSHVDPSSLLNCRLVCKKWNSLIERDVWKILNRNANKRSFSKLNYEERLLLELPWYVYYAIYKWDPFHKNLIKNPSGKDKFRHWLSEYRGQKIVNIEPKNGCWGLESIPCGSNPLPTCEDFEGYSGCFVTSFNRSSKYQIIDLKECGISNKIMDEFEPPIIVSDWYAPRFDCGSSYYLFVKLLDENKRKICHYEDERVMRQWIEPEWNQVTKCFENYGPGVRYIKFKHEGKDTQFWAGYYGVKIAGAAVKVSLPTVNYEMSDSE